MERGGKMTNTDERELNVLDQLTVLAKNKVLIARMTAACLVLSLMAGLLLPKSYRAETRLLAPQQAASGASGQLLSQLAGGAAGLSAMLSPSSQGELYVGLARSRTVLDNIIARFQLLELYGEDTNQDARKKLLKRLDVKLDKKSNIILVAVEDRDPRRASDMANAFVDELKGMTRGLAVTEAAQRRLFYEEQLKDTKFALVRAEEGLRGFQERTGALHVDEQVKAQIKNIAMLRAEIASKEVEIQVMRTYATAYNPDLQKAQEAVRGMRSELAKLETRGGTDADPLMSTGRMPSVGTEYLRKLRDLKFSEALYELLMKQYSIARLDEARDAAPLQVIDRAVPPDRQTGPKLAVIVAVGTLGGLLAGALLVLLLEYNRSLAGDPKVRAQVEQLKAYATSQWK